METESLWSHKPWWCQPWSILLTGTLLIAGSWILFHTIWLTVVVALPVLAWMGFFIVVAPRLWTRYAANLYAEKLREHP